MTLRNLLLFVGGGALVLCVCGILAVVGLAQYGAYLRETGQVPESAAQPLPTRTRRALPTLTPRSSRTATTIPASPTAPVLPVVGETVTAGGIGFIVNSIRAVASLDGRTPPEGHYYLLVDATVENISRENGAAYSPYYFSVKDDNGFTYQFALPYVEPAMHAGNMPLGDKVRGNVLFEIPTAAADLILVYDPIVIGGGYEQIRIHLGTPPTP